MRLHSFYYHRTLRLKFFLLLVVSSHTFAGNPDQWFLMARHGECAPISTLSRKIPDLGNPRSLEDFTSTLEKNGIDLEQEPYPVPKGEVVAVRVEAYSLSLIFVTSDHCESHIGVTNEQLEGDT
jgi:hypothetical protein